MGVAHPNLHYFLTVLLNIFVQICAANTSKNNLKKFCLHFFNQIAFSVYHTVLNLYHDLHSCVWWGLPPTPYQETIPVHPHCPWRVYRPGPMGRGCTHLVRVPYSSNVSVEAAITLYPGGRPFDRSPKAMMMNSLKERKQERQRDRSGRERARKTRPLWQVIDKCCLCVEVKNIRALKLDLAVWF